MFHDRARIYVEGGRGGDGCVSFRREARVPRGGPDGGDGGRGGDVVLVGDSSRRDLGALRTSRHYRAAAGAHGQGKRKHGARGEDQVVLVPPGTQIAGLGGERFDLIRGGQRAAVAEGGTGGHGNKRFASSTRQAPRFAERGLEGASGWIELRMKLLADVGLIGLPNAGKSSLLARLTRAAPKVADYPFTTVEPVLGTLDTDERQLVIADIPGLIEGAAEGAGLGLEFLAHVERCRVLVHLVEVAAGAEVNGGGVGQVGSGVPGESASRERAGDAPAAAHEHATNAHEAVRGELAAYGAGLDTLPELVVLSKSDLVSEAHCDELVAAWSERLGNRALGVLAVSSATGFGTEALVRALLAAVPEGDAVAEAADDDAGSAAGSRGGVHKRPAGAGAGLDGAESRREAFTPRPPVAEGRFTAEHRVYRPQAEQGFRIEQIGDGIYAVEGRGVEVLARRHDLANTEALAYLEQRLREIGVVSALRAAGFEDGDEVRIGEESFELDLG